MTGSPGDKRSGALQLKGVLQRRTARGAAQTERWVLDRQGARRARGSTEGPLILKGPGARCDADQTLSARCSGPPVSVRLRPGTPLIRARARGAKVPDAKRRACPARRGPWGNLLLWIFARAHYRRRAPGCEPAAETTLDVTVGFGGVCGGRKQRQE